MLFHLLVSVFIEVCGRPGWGAHVVGLGKNLVAFCYKVSSVHPGIAADLNVPGDKSVVVHFCLIAHSGVSSHPSPGVYPGVSADYGVSAYKSIVIYCGTVAHLGVYSH